VSVTDRQVAATRDDDRGDAPRRRVVLLPPDERPVHLRDPALLAAIAEVELVTPPSELLPSFRRPGDVDGMAAWLEATVTDDDAVVVSVEALAHGGLVPSRLTDDPTEVAVTRLAALRRVRAGARGAVLDACAFVTRLPDLDDASEEPGYWAEHGRDLAHLSRLLDADAPDAEVARARAAIPVAHVDDLARRRLRNHTVLLAALSLAADGTLDGLVLSSDDTAPQGLPAREGRWVDAWLRTLDLGDRVHRYAGADEVASVRLARWTRGLAERPLVRVEGFDNVDPGGLGRVAPYEALPIRDTADGQLRSAGAVPVAADDPGDVDLVLAVVAPDPEGDWALAPPAPDPARDARDEAVADRIADLVEAGTWVAVADCSHPNGGSPALVRRLAARGVLHRLGAYAGWNTAGNTVGAAVAQAVLGRGRGGPGSAHERLLAHRLVEDVGYMAQERTALRARRRAAGAPIDPHPDEHDAVARELTVALQARLAELGPLGTRWRVAPGSVALTWGRSFACDLTLEPALGAERSAGPDAGRAERERADG
jgi:hypothetical protein